MRFHYSNLGQILRNKTLGIDIGGANLKAVFAQFSGLSIPFALWKQPDQLIQQLQSIDSYFDHPKSIAITMTGELCDCFPTKRHGVEHILSAVEKAFQGRELQIWSVDTGFLSVAQARENWLSVAASNWQVLATWVGNWLPQGEGILIDIGSTTTDLIPISNSLPCSLGKTDISRLRSGELVYTGTRRTPICALVNEGVAAEWFATIEDVYTLLDYLPEAPEFCETADNRPMTIPYAHARLARMLGGDSELLTLAEIKQFAEKIRNAQIANIVQNLNQITERNSKPFRHVVLSGSGEFLGKLVWESYQKQFTCEEPTSILSMSERFNPMLSSAACALSLSALAEGETRH